MGRAVLLAGKVIYFEGWELFYQMYGLEEEGEKVAAFYFVETLYLIDQEEGVGVDLHLRVIVFDGVSQGGKEGLIFGVIVGLNPQIAVVGSQLLSFRTGNIKAITCLSWIPPGAAVYIDADSHPP